MHRVTLNHSDTIEALLPVLERAMEQGDVCQIRNIHYLGVSEVLALRMLAMADKLIDVGTGKICHAAPGFLLLGVDAYGAISILA